LPIRLALCCFPHATAFDDIISATSAAGRGHPYLAKMPDFDINPAALSRPSISLSTPILSNKSITVSAPSSQKAPKTSQLIPTRIDLEPIYTKLKSHIDPEQWPVYKEATTQLFIGQS
jgi:hypothetical protein